jgi:hypothetical protein
LGGASLPLAMRKGLLVVGIVLLVIGAALLGWGFASSSQTYNVVVGEGLQPNANTIGSDPVTISWSGGTSSTAVTLYGPGAACSGTSIIAGGTGASGSFTATIPSGAADCIVVSGSSASVTVANHGFGVLELIGAIILILGLLLAVLGVIRKPKVRAAAAAPVPQTAAEVSDAATAAGSDVYTAGPGAAALTPGARANQVCNYCGATNEAWLTNCRNCKRPLASTSQ